MDITPTGAGDITIDVAANVAQDAATNVNEAATQVVTTFDGTAPTVDIQSAPATINLSAYTVTIEFSEPVTGFEEAEIVVANAAKSNFTGSGTTYTVDIAPTGAGDITIDVAADVAQDAATNGNEAATQVVTTFDGTAPTVDIQNAPATINLSAYTVTIEFSEPVTGFEEAEIVVTNARKSNFAGSGTTYTVDVTPTGAGDITIDVAADVAQDAATNVNEAATQVVTTFDGTAPTVDIQNAPATINLSAYTVTIEFSEPVAGFEAAEIVVANAAKSNFTGSGTTYTADITPTGAGDITIDVAADVAQDAATNGNEAATQVVTTFDGTAPTVDIQNAPASSNSTPYTVTIEFSEPVTGFEEAEIVVANAVKSNFAGSGTTYTVDIAPTGAGDITIDVPADVAQDAATNGNEVATQVVTAFDDTAPTVAILNAPATSNTTPYTVTIEFSEPVTGFEEAEIVVANAAKSNFTGSGTTYTVDIAPDGNGDITIDVPADVVLNGNEPAMQVVTVFDNRAPVIVITPLNSSDNRPTLTGTVDDPTALVTISVDGIPYPASVIGTDWSVEITQALADGVYNVVATAEDDAGNIGSDTSADELILAGTTVIPTVTVDPLETFDFSPALSGTVDDAVATISVTIDGQDYTAINDGAGSWNLAQGIIQALDVDTYDVVVEAVSASDLVGTDNTGDELRILPAATALSEATDVTVNSFRASWDEVSGGVLSYVIEVSEFADFSIIFTSFQEPEGEDDFVIVSGLNYGTQYFARVQVRYQSGDVSDYSNTIAVQTLVDPNTELDSLALVAIYEATNGDSWSNNSNWKTGRLSNWFGVTIEDARVIRLDLPSNNLRGSIPAISEGLSALISLDFSGNELISIDVADGLLALQSADVSSNLLPFGAFQNLQANGATVIYEGQGTLFESLTTLQEVGTEYTFVRAISGTGNVYRWFKDDVLFAINAGNLTLPITRFEQEGAYRVEITNGDFPDLTLEARPIFLKVSSLERDRLSLLDLYNATEGDGWTNNDNWEVDNPNVDTWFGVTVEDNRVTGLTLSENNLMGEVPESLLDIVNLSVLDLSGNLLSGIPDLRRLPKILAPDVSDNRLDFGDLEGVAEVPSINYLNQKLLGEASETRLPKGSDYIVSVPVGGTMNNYQWFFKGEVDKRAIAGATLETNTIVFLDYLKMGEYYVQVTNPLVPGLTLMSEPQTVLATTDVQFVPTYLDLDGERARLDEGDGFLMKIERPGQPFDTLDVQMVSSQGLLFEDVVLGDYLVSLRTDSLLLREKGGRIDSVRLLPTYFKSSFLWEEADTIFIRDMVNEEMIMQQKPINVEIGENSIRLLVESDFLEPSGEEARIEARRKVKRAGCSLRRRRRATGGRGFNDNEIFDLVAYKETDDEGRVTFDNLPDGFYRLNIEYPGIPMDPNSFIEFEIGEGGLEQNSLTLEATVDETGIEVELIEILRVLKEYFDEVQVYPNPANYSLNVAYKGLRYVGVTAQLLDLQGRLVMQRDLPRSLNQFLTMDIREVQEGLYLLRIMDPERAESILVFKIVIDR